MTTLVKRLPMLVFAVVMFAFVFYGTSLPAHSTVAALQATPDSSLPAKQPVIIGTLKGTPVEGIPGSFCWPDATGTPKCDFVDDPQPPVSISIANGDAIAFTVDPASPAPLSLHGTLLDDKNADGDQVEVDLSATSGTFTATGLTDGSHRLKVDAAYGTGQNQPFVSYVFLLSVSSTTLQATAEVTAIAMVTEPPTETAATLEAPIAPTATIETMVAAVTPEVTPASSLVATQTQASTGVAILPTATPTVIEPTVAPTATVVAPTVEAPTIEAPTVIAPTVEVQPATTIPPVDASATPVPAGGSSINAVITVPTVSILVGGRTFNPIAINVCTTGANGETICVNRPSSANTERIFASPNDAAQITFQGTGLSASTISLFSSDGTKLISKQDVRPDTLILYNLPATPGNYVLSVEFVYGQGKATYYYRLGIGG